MKIGILYEMDWKKLEKEQKEGKATVGIEPLSLIDEINFLEISYSQDSSRVLAELKRGLFVLVGKIEDVTEKKEVEQDGDNRQTDK